MSDNTTRGRIHHVLVGECTDSIAAAYGLPTAKVWEHPKNAELREKRSKRDELVSGDQLFIPPPETKSEPVRTETATVFVMKRPMRVLRLKLVRSVPQKPVAAAMLPPHTFENTVQPLPTLEPWADAPVVVNAGSYSWEGKADGEGKVTFEVPLQFREAVLTIAPDTEEESKRQLQFGMMDPIEEMTGVTQRLGNLGYRVAPVAPVAQLTEQAANALKDFQFSHGLTVTGEPDEETVAKLKTL